MPVLSQDISDHASSLLYLSSARHSNWCSCISLWEVSIIGVNFEIQWRTPLPVQVRKYLFSLEGFAAGPGLQICTMEFTLCPPLLIVSQAPLSGHLFLLKLICSRSNTKL